MTRTIFLFGAVLFAGLIAGGQYLVWWDYDPAGNSAQFYVGKLQYAIGVIGIPLFSVQILTALFTIAAALLWRKVRPVNYILGIAVPFCLIGVGLTAFGAIPLLNQVASWNSASPPAEWLEVARTWWWLHNVRFVMQLSAFVLLIIAVFRARDATRTS